MFYITQTRVQNPKYEPGNKEQEASYQANLAEVRRLEQTIWPDMPPEKNIITAIANNDSSIVVYRRYWPTLEMAQQWTQMSQQRAIVIDSIIEPYTQE